MDSAANFQELITCGICSELFDESSKCPRMLSCGHSFCHSCLEKRLVQNPPACPTCKKGIQFRKADSIPINFSLKSLIDIRGPISIQNSDSEENVEPQSDTKEHASKSKPGISSRKGLSEGYCKEHENFKELRCMDCEVWICGTCVSLNHKHCRTLVVEEAHKELRKQVENELRERKSIAETLTESLKVLEEEKTSLIEEIKKQELEIKTKRLDLKDREKRIEELESKKSTENEFYDQLKQHHEMVENSLNDTEFSKYMNDICKFLKEEKKKVQEAIHYLNLPHTRQELETLCQNGPIYAVEDRYNGVRYGKVAVKDEKIWINSFQTEIPNAARPIATFVSLKKLLFQYSGTTELPKTAFIELTPDGGGINPIHIVVETNGLSPRAKNFVLLCSALKGSSYLRLPLVKYSYFPHFKEINPGPPPVLEGIRNDDCKTPVKKFGVYGMYDSNSWFRVQLKNNPFYSYEFGFIASGLQSLQDLRGECSVTQCGIVV